MDWNSLVERIKSEISSLWLFRPRGEETIELISPFSTLSACYVSLFITFRNNEYIVTDGAFIEEEKYNIEIPNDNENFKKVLDFLIEDSDIKQTKNKWNQTIYYQKTDDIKLISRLVYNVGTFIANVINAAVVIQSI